MDGLSDRGSIPLSSTKNGRNSRNTVERVPAVFVLFSNKKCYAMNFLVCIRMKGLNTQGEEKSNGR